ncbi:hypothetical protein HMPREF0970_02177 [Schaalia odontolytica F0309]|uniref:Uncharacterized protein n=1 Tax=Schaalia odontolytica F0309 TaxID=649742 RepID=D4U1S4_9ACTO|nr:hypothetical protein HMPREF0970_02177 [Schaalia odontolytica F0309]
MPVGGGKAWPGSPFGSTGALQTTGAWCAVGVSGHVPPLVAREWVAWRSSGGVVACSG